MAEIINLRQAKKAKARVAKEKTAEANRVEHGTPKDIRDLARARAEKQVRDIDGHRITKHENETPED